jgi:putative membrane protein
MIRSIACMVLITGLATSAAFAADPATASASAGAAPTVDAFLKETAVGNQFEIDSSKLALSKSNSTDVKAFATQMVTDHGQAAVKFKKAVSEAKLKGPSEALDDKHEAVMKDLRAKSGGDFDRAYIEAQKQGHVETVAMFESYAKDGDNARMKQFAEELLPTLHQHLEHVRKLNPS